MKCIALLILCFILCAIQTADSAKSLTSQMSELPNDFVRDLMKDHLEIEVFNRLDELNFVVAGVLCNKVMEEVILALDKAHKSLVIKIILKTAIVKVSVEPIVSLGVVVATALH